VIKPSSTTGDANASARTVAAGPNRSRAMMCIAATALSIVLNGAAAVAADGTSHIHVTDRIVNTLIDRGIAGSETFQALVAELDAAPIVVFVGCDLFMPEGLSGRLNFVSRVGEVRYVRVSIRCTLSFRTQLSMLAHELQHALEIGRNPEIEDVESMESYYEDVGIQSYVNATHRSFETDAALAIQRRVYSEIADKPARNDDGKAGQLAPSP
jgi:hypothetical protein